MAVLFFIILAILLLDSLITMCITLGTMTTKSPIFGVILLICLQVLAATAITSVVMDFLKY